MKRFVDDFVCRGRVVCSLCRDPGAAGDEFRSAMARIRVLPGDGVFACPHGVVADDVPLIAAHEAPLPTAARDLPNAHLLVICETCEHSRALADDAPGCALVTCHGCNRPGSPSARRFAELLSSGAPCPHPDGDRWRANNRP